MSARVHVVTDSTAGLSAHEVLRLPLTVVPLQVVIGGTSYDDGATSSDAVAEALKTFTPVSTSRPAPQSFADTYAECAARAPSRSCRSISPGTCRGRSRPR